MCSFVQTCRAVQVGANGGNLHEKVHGPLLPFVWAATVKEIGEYFNVFQGNLIFPAY